MNAWEGGVKGFFNQMGDFTIIWEVLQPRSLKLAKKFAYLFAARAGSSLSKQIDEASCTLLIMANAVQL